MNLLSYNLRSSQSYGAGVNTVNFPASSNTFRASIYLHYIDITYFVINGAAAVNEFYHVDFGFSKNLSNPGTLIPGTFAFGTTASNFTKTADGPSVFWIYQKFYSGDTITTYAAVRSVNATVSAGQIYLNINFIYELVE